MSCVDGALVWYSVRLFLPFVHASFPVFTFLVGVIIFSFE